MKRKNPDPVPTVANKMQPPPQITQTPPPNYQNMPSTSYATQMEYYNPYQMYMVDPQYQAQYNQYYNQMFYPQQMQSFDAAQQQIPGQPPLPPPKSLTSQPPPPPVNHENSITPQTPQNNTYSNNFLNNPQNRPNNIQHNNGSGTANTRRDGLINNFPKHINPPSSPYANNKYPYNMNAMKSPIGVKPPTKTPSDDVTVNTKSKRKSMSTRYTRKKEWDREDAIKALQLEHEFNRSSKAPTLMLRFPDPELNKEVVRKFSPNIDLVHFQNPSVPRFCFVTLRPNTNIKEEVERLSNLNFGVGKITVKLHHTDDKIADSPEEIDPYTLYIGNLPTNVTVKAVKDKFPSATRIDIGYAQRMKYTRYAFIRYQSIEDSTAAYREAFNLVMESRSLIVRFCRHKGNVGLPGESKKQNTKQPFASPSTSNKTESISDEFINDHISDMDLLSEFAKRIESNSPMISEVTSPSISSDRDQLNDVLDVLKEIDTNPCENIFTEQNTICETNPSTANTETLPIIDSVDSKTNIMEEIRQLKETSLAPEKIAIKEEPKSSLDKSTSSAEKNVSVRIKDEPVENGEDAQNDANIQQDDEEQDEEDDDDDFDDDDDDGECYDDTLDEEEELDDHNMSMFHWDNLRRKEILNEKEEKPNVDELTSKIQEKILNSNKKVNYLNSSSSVTITKPSSEFDDLFDGLNPEDDGF